MLVTIINKFYLLTIRKRTYTYIGKIPKISFQASLIKTEYFFYQMYLPWIFETQMQYFVLIHRFYLLK